MAANTLPKDGRFLALLLLLIVLATVYLGGIHWWFVEPHLEYANEMQDLREQEQRFRHTIAERAEVEKRLADVRTYEQSNQAFLAETDANAASAALIQRLKTSVSEHAPDQKRCQLVSQQSYNGGEEELYPRATIQVRMRCDLEPFAAILYDLENGKPYLFVNQLTIHRQQSWVPPGGKPAVSLLDIRFNLSGYMRQSGAGKAPK